MEKILIVDDDEEIRKLIGDFLSKENFEVEGAKNGKLALDSISKEKKDFQLIVLDIMLPDISGIELCKEIRKISTVPIIMLTARSEDIDKIIGLEVGADDYLTKPFNPKELIARIKAILRRTYSNKNSALKCEEIIKIAFRTSENELVNLEINPKARRINRNSVEVKLTNKEYNILIYLINNKNIVISREKLLENIWGFDYMGESRTIDVHVKELRKKIGDPGGILIETIWSVGYRLNYNQDLN